MAPARIGTIARIVRGGGGGGGGRGGGNAGVAGSSKIAKAYAFVGDRLRAVRQDLTVQGLALAGGAAAVGAAEVLETSANFYVVAGYLMSDEVGDPRGEAARLRSGDMRDHEAARLGKWRWNKGINHDLSTIK